MKAQDYVEITFNEGLSTSYKLKFTVINKTNECSVKLSKTASQSTALEIPTIVTINNSDYYVTVIDTMAFKDKSIFSSVSLPDSLKIIRGHAFYKCTGLTGNLIIPENVTYIGEHAFNNCTGLTGNLIIPNKVKTIGNNAFYVCNGFSDKLIIPNSVTSIGNYAFYRCTKFTELSFEENSNLKTIGDYAFAGYYNGSSSDYKMEFTGELIIPNSVTSIGSHAFNLCTKFTKLSFEENSNLKTIGDYAFTGYNTFSTISMEFAGELIIPNSVTSIGNYAFFYCPKLTKLSFEENPNLKTIGNNSFYYNGFTGELTIPNSLTSIGSSAFYNCPFNKIICYSATPASFSGSNSIFYASSAKKPTIYVPATSLETYKSTWNKDTNRIDANGFPTFIKNGSIDDVNNWYILENGNRIYRLPTQSEEIAINAALTINENEILNVKSLGYCKDGDLTIKEGGQLICDNIKNAIKVEKNIEAHSTTGNTTWTTISSPFGKDMDPSEITNLTTGNYSLYRYDEPSSMWQNYKNSANNGFTTFEAGRGYLYSNSDNITLVFKGTAIAKNISYNLTNEAEILTGFHLVGNPYTHNISLSNLVTTGNILAEGYYSLSNEGAWGVKYGEETEIKPCQGILIKTTEEGILYINSTQTRNAKKSVSNILAISVSNKKYNDITYISFNQGIGLDKIAHENKNIPMIYIPCQDADYAIAIKDKNFKEIPINFEVGTMGEYTISVSQKECGFNRLYLYDKLTGQTINILKNDYTFFAKTSDEPDRFILKSVNDEILDNFTYINNGNLIIGNINGNANINIFDVLGRNVLQTSCSDDEYQISTDRFSAGVYIIRKSDENGVKTQKVLID